MPATASINPGPVIAAQTDEFRVLQEIIREACGPAGPNLARSALKHLHTQAMDETGYPKQGAFAESAAYLLLQSQLSLLDQAITAHDSPGPGPGEAAEADLWLSIQSARSFMRHIAGAQEAETGFIGKLEQSCQENREWAEEMLGYIKSGKWPHTEKTFAESVFEDPPEDPRPDPGAKHAAKEIFRQAKRNIVQDREVRGNAARFIENAAAAATAEIIYTPHLKELVQDPPK